MRYNGVRCRKYKDLPSERGKDMNILIIGCGKVGSRLADVLCQLGHDVAIIAQKRESFDLLSDDFSGFTIQGVPIDLDILRQAGIEGCDAIAAVTEDDNTNIMVCQIAREIFNVSSTRCGRTSSPALIFSRSVRPTSPFRRSMRC